MQPFTNQAFLSYNGTSYASNTTVGQIVDAVTVTKRSVTPTYSLGSEETFVINVVNSGNTPVTGATVSDDLGGYIFTPANNGTPITVYPYEYVEGSLLYFVNGTPQPAPVPVADNVLSVSGLTIPANGSVTLIYAARVTEFAPLDADGTITNTVTVTGTGIITPVTAQAITTPSAEPVLSIIKSLSPQVITGNAPVTYTFNISNTGSVATEADGNLQVTDTFNPPLTDITVTLNGVILTPDQYSYNETTGVFSTNPGVITVPAATFVQDATTGAYSVTPGEAVLTVSGTLNTSNV